ncbi:hydroxymethylglutaryl-CoA lyase [Paracoccus sp. 1_MG-2023]|uniref:hydroxymethylglutaryl-CoA lyase n=1 Tax=unclassified Paracoccus (in: a-proteobacteria) TaxID=2688777 RepID=UPI001C0A2B72|nr:MULTISPECIES: hydroxymethylglutaryl-CoA lyase [unclassified Paracoccus (in: a-proteobacteria)]MBU2958286.1 hydroxymethylglutaryl-CoA lyase [Paracoccus sp. C2R09]MDO6668413.1 hydroxymethylglutaryl-CoA lyase [Paracoccus sp. 1_MG-2023]
MVSLCEVGPRDGLQNLDRVFSVEERIEMITRLAAAGIRHIEAVSMVHPARVPQMAGAEEVLAGLPPLPDIRIAALVLNLKGAERAVATRATELRFAIVASDTFCRRNQGMSAEDSLAEFARAAAVAREAGRDITAVIATAYGCPFEGEMPEDRVAAMAQSVIRAGAGQVVLADTIGVAGPNDIHRVHRAMAPVLGDTGWGVHLHDTRGTGTANLIAAIGLGAEVADTSIGGLGGCPFAPRATGNIATEDVNYLLSRQGMPTGLSHDRLTALVEWLEERLPGRISGQLARAGWFGQQEVGA